MRISVLIVLLLLISLGLIAQNNIDSNRVDSNLIIPLVETTDKEFTQELNLSFNYDLASFLNNAFITKYFASAFIDDELKSENKERLNTKNNPFGLRSDFCLQYRNKPGLLFGSSSLGYSFAIEWHSINEILFTDDFYSLVFFGTKQFAAKNANLHNVSNNNLNFYQIKGGLFKEDELRGVEYGFQTAVILGNQYSSFKTEDAEIYVDSLGKYINLNGRFQYNSTEFTDNSFTRIQGLGMSVDLFFQKEVKYDFKFRLDIKNLGFIHWNSNTQIYNEDETINFEGIAVDDIFKNTVNTSKTTIKDSLENYINSKSTYDNLYILSPVDISVYYSKYFFKNINTYASFNYRINSLSDFYLLLGTDYCFSKNLSLGGVMNYGGYTKFNIGFNFQVKIKTNFAIKLQSRYITGLIGHSFSGIGGFLQLNYKF